MVLDGQLSFSAHMVLITHYQLLMIQCFQLPKLQVILVADNLQWVEVHQVEVLAEAEAEAGRIKIIIKIIVLN